MSCIYCVNALWRLRFKFLLHPVNCRRFCFWCRQSVFFCLCMKYFGNCWTDLRHIHTVDVFGPLLGQGHQGQKKWYFLALSAACVQFMFGKTSLASSFCLYTFHWFSGHDTLWHSQGPYAICMPVTFLQNKFLHNSKSCFYNFVFFVGKWPNFAKISCLAFLGAAM